MKMFWSLVEKDERISLDTFDAFLIILSMCLSKWREKSISTPRSRTVSALVNL